MADLISSLWANGVSVSYQDVVAMPETLFFKLIDKYTDKIEKQNKELKKNV